MTRKRQGELSRRSMAEAWWAPLIDVEREQTWQAAKKQIHAAIQRVRMRDGYEHPSTSALGDHLYSTPEIVRARKTA